MLPELIGTGVLNEEAAQDGWSIKEVREFARLAPKKDEPGQPYDIDNLDKRDVQRVADGTMPPAAGACGYPSAATLAPPG
jgi:hypothetical protein